MSNKNFNNILITPYGGKLVNLISNEDETPELKNRATKLNSVQISERSMCDFEMMSTGAFSPLDKFMNQADYQSVV